jgi:hypothetical protein
VHVGWPLARVTLSDTQLLVACSLLPFWRWIDVDRSAGVIEATDHRHLVFRVRLPDGSRSRVRFWPTEPSQFEATARERGWRLAFDATES